MKFCMVNKLTIMNTFVLLTLLLNITHLAIITNKTIKIMENLKCEGRGEWKKASIFYYDFFPYLLITSRTKNDTNLKKKTFKIFFKTMVGTICAICTVTGFPCLTIDIVTRPSNVWYN